MRFWWILLIVVLSPHAAARGEGAQLFERGVSAYRAQDYGEAQRLFDAALEDDAVLASPEAQAAVLSNLGNVAYREGRIVQAVAHYTAASRLLPRDSGIETNLSIARAEAGLEPAVPADLGSTLLHTARSFTKTEVERLVVGALLLWLCVLIFEALRGGALARTLSWAGLALVVLSFVPYFATISNTPRGREMIVPEPVAKTSSRARQDKAASIAASFTPFHSEPRADSPTLAQLSPATEVVRTDALPGWVEVRHEGRVGWIPADRLTASDPRPRRTHAKDSRASDESRTP